MCPLMWFLLTTFSVCINSPLQGYMSGILAHSFMSAADLSIKISYTGSFDVYGRWGRIWVHTACKGCQKTTSKGYLKYAFMHIN